MKKTVNDTLKKKSTVMLNTNTRIKMINNNKI